ncbi:MAG TPA: TatD family hydrolase [Steroidobacteraceae bacterium]|nr:TatD family hydrolase [Steroidobacteraceae bacterium]
MQLIDIGINLAHSSYNRDRRAVIDRARAAGVCRMIVTGSDLAGIARAVELVREYPDLLSATAGIHPHHAAEHDAAASDALRTWLKRPEVSAAGECGLDYCRNYAPRDLQLASFRQQLEIAAELGRPVFLHQRDAHEDFIGLVREFRSRLPRAVAHCFTGTKEEARACLDHDLHIGITGWINDERRGAHLREVVRFVPANRLMLETDGPYLLPRDLKPKPASRRNEPMYLPHILATVAAARGEAPEELAASTTRTAREFFSLAGPTC